MQGKKITFILPNLMRKPSGGAMIVFRYAGMLAERGHRVTVLFNCERTLSKRKWPRFLKRTAIRTFMLFHPTKDQFPQGAKKKAIFGILDTQVPDGDFCFATAATTAVPVHELSASKGKKAYLIQDYENWTLSDEELRYTYTLMENVTISKWLRDIVEKYSGRKCVYIGNCIDTDEFMVTKPPEERNPHSVAALYHEDERKGFGYTWEAILSLRRKYPDLEVRIFGMPKRPGFFPSWVFYTEAADKHELNEIYNSSSVFICSTIQEGFGLTGAEAMACGAALASSDYGGVHDYAEDGVNALLCPVGDVDAMVDNVTRLMEDRELRLRLIREGIKTIRAMSWTAAVDKFECEVLHADRGGGIPR